MKFRRVQLVLAAVACVGMACPPGALAAESASNVKDVELRPGGVLVGQVIDQQGVVQAGSAVVLQYDEQIVVRTSTDENGIFAAQGLRGGQYQIMTENGQTLCRLWATNTAPPAATDAAVVVTGNEVVRGQWGSGGGQWLAWVRSHPYITAGIVAAAVATPLAIAAADDDDDGPNS